MMSAMRSAGAFGVDEFIGRHRSMDENSAGTSDTERALLFGRFAAKLGPRPVGLRCPALLQEGLDLAQEPGELDRLGVVLIAPDL